MTRTLAKWYRSESVRAVDTRVSSRVSYEDELTKEKSVELTTKDSAAYYDNCRRRGKSGSHCW